MDVEDWAVIVIAALFLAFWGSVIFVAIHFLSKIW